MLDGLAFQAPTARMYRAVLTDAGFVWPVPGEADAMVEVLEEREDKYDVEAGFVLPSGLLPVPVGGRLEHRTVHLTSQYFDTDNHDLHRANAALRMRTGEQDAGWQLKLGRGRSRLELRLPLEASGSVEIPEGLAELVRGLAYGRPLVPVAEVRTQRTVARVLSVVGEVICEVADDQVQSSASGSAGGAVTLTKWREVEVELGTGDERLLDVIGKALRRAGARRSRSSSKLQRALDPARRRPTRPGPKSSKDAFAATVQAYLAEQHDAVLAGDLTLRRDGSGVHDTRVALRRLRSTLRVFGALFDAERAAALDAELVWFAGLLGSIRDAEVQQGRLSKAIDALPPEVRLGPIAADVHAHLLGVELSGRAALKVAMDSPRYFALLDSIRDWAERAPTRPDVATGERQLGRIVAQAQRKARRRLRQAVRAGSTHPELWHRARKSAKRARYALEATGPRRSNQPTKRAIKRFKEIQTVLGEHQDSVVAAQILRALASRTPSRPDENGFSYGLLYEREQAAGRRARKQARRLG